MLRLTALAAAVLAATSHLSPRAGAQNVTVSSTTVRVTEVLSEVVSSTSTVSAPAEVAPGEVVASGKWGKLWKCSPTFKVMRDTPVPAGSSASVALYAARNEFEPIQLVLRPSTAIANVKVVPHRLTGPNGAKLDAWNITVRNVGYVHVVNPTDPNGRPGMYPDPLPEQTPFTAPAGVNSPLWITLYVPPQTSPGVYTGTVDVSGDGIGKLSVPLRLHVWNFTLPTVSSLRTAYGCDLYSAARYQGASTLEQKRQLTEIYNREFWRHRVAPFAPYTFYAARASLEGGAVRLDFTDFDTAISKYFALFNSFMLPHFGMNDSAGLDMGSEYPRLKVDYMRAVAEHLAEKGQIAKGYAYIADEPEPDRYDAIKEAAKLVRMADSRIKILLTEQVEPDLVGSVDIWVPILDQYNQANAQARQAKGEQVWWYVCTGPRHPYPNNFIDYPAIDHRILHWMTWRYGVNGILYWQTTYWNQNPWETAMSYSNNGGGMRGNGDGRLLYPPVRKASDTFVAKGPVPSMRWELIREGVEDYDYFSILRKRIDDGIKNGRKPGELAAAREALELVDGCARSLTDYTQDARNLEQARIKVAAAIESLQ